MEINIIRDLDFLRVYFQNGFSAYQIGKLNGNAAVKTAGTCERGVKRFGAICRRKDNDPVIALKSVHFGKQLIQSLFSFIVSAYLTVTLFADCIDLINKYNAWCLFLRLLEQVTDL